MNMFKSAFLAACFVLGSAATVFALTPPPGAGRLDIEIKKGQIQKDPAAPREDIHVSYKGVLQKESIPVNLIMGSDNSSADKMIAKMVEANSKGDPIAMASLFMPEERAVIMDSYQDPKLLKPNMQFFRQVTSAALEGYVVDKNVIYLLVSFEGQHSKKLVMPSVRTKEGYFLTNKQADLSTLAELAAAYPAGQIKAAQD